MISKGKIFVLIDVVMQVLATLVLIFDIFVFGILHHPIASFFVGILVLVSAYKTALYLDKLFND